MVEVKVDGRAGCSCEHKSNPKLLSKMAIIAAMSALVSPSSNCSLAQIEFANEVNTSPERPDTFWTNLSCCTGALRKRKVPVEQCESGVASQEQTDASPSLIVWDKHERNQVIRAMAKQSLSGLREQHKPISVSDGMAGVYIFVDSNSRRVGVFKPSDEEVGCDQNPKGYSPKESVTHVRSGLEPGQSMFREVAASILDHNHFVGVPDTCLVDCTASVLGGVKKSGSLQTFVESDGSVGDLSHSLFSVLDVQKIAMFDLRTLNIDRHDGNILYRMKEGKANLIPIDHGCCLPRRLEVCDFEWCWMNWPQIKEKVHPDVKEYISSLDVNHDLSLLKQFGIALSTDSTRVFRVMTTFLQKAVAADLTLFDIAKVTAREEETTPSRLERVVTRAKWLAAAEASLTGRKFDETFNEKLIAVVDDLVRDLVAA
eukprot:c8103_g1_i2.p1 GENE.c8103_g1_i2~~c8103_g1_i2.p1  ORF type:complete len:428 (-),score=101.18 c8103_g1_i2:418-1701(-)